MSEEIDINPEIQEELPTADATTPEAPVDAAPEQKVHPAYEKLLNELPEAWHAKVMPHLQEQDRYFQQEIEKYSPYKEFAESKVDPASIRSSLQLADVAINDPVALYRNLATHLRSQGLLDEADEADEAADQLEEDSEYEIDPAIRKEFEARDEMIRQQQEYLQSIQFEAEVAREQEMLEKQISEINSRYEISPAQMDSIMRILEIQLQQDENATIYTAAKELAEVTGIRYVAKTDLPRADAPFVVGNAGGAGVPAQSIEIPKDDRAKKAMLAQMFEAQLKGNANSL